LDKLSFQNGLILGLVSNGKAQSRSDMVDFWDAYQDNGNRVDYSTAFGGVGWNNDTFKPRYDMQPTNAYMMFRSTGITGDLVEMLGNLGITLDFSKATNTAYIFNNAAGITRIGVVDLRSSINSIKGDSTFLSCTSLVRIEKIVVDETVSFNTNFIRGCTALEYVGFEGVIANSLAIKESPLLNTDCINGIIDHLATVTTAQTLTFHASVSLSDAQKTAIQNKGWTLVQ
jgi:hypothetical protein